MNFLYLHTHDTGRHVAPYGFAMPTPRIAQLAREGVLFRQAFSAAPVCSPSRAALLHGNWPHENGMIGLAHRGSRLNDASQHLANVLGDAGWQCVLVGEQHVAPPEGLAALGYHDVPPVASTRAADVAPAAVRWLRERDRSRSFFLSVGLHETHRPYPPPDPGEPADDPRYLAPPPGMPDTPAIRAEVAGLRRMARAADAAFGAVLDALRETGAADDTLVVLTTDHGLPWPGAKCTVGDAGTGVMLLVRGPGGFTGGKVVDAMVSQLDIFPTVCALAGLPRPPWLRGRSLVPLVDGSADALHEALFAEVTCHAAAEPMRSIRTPRWRYIRRFDGSDLRVLANVDAGAAKTLFIEHGWRRWLPETESLHDLVLDPGEHVNLAARPDHAQVLADLRARLADWMEQTGDPLLDPDWQPPAQIHVVPRTSVRPEGD
ncbi:sulfatase family protein [Xylophilus sp.]|uniref:sulfatase family protein n=1 Tax=Xylophilus sp. TaxID=2653893 RepID=UPI0013BD186A|nr:sulfatase [Xylophilus sp.]KAF1048212.1 MAG: Choline-sulfatase [Xylophilus sp.]